MQHQLLSRNAPGVGHILLVTQMPPGDLARLANEPNNVCLAIPREAGGDHKARGSWSPSQLHCRARAASAPDLPIQACQRNVRKHDTVARNPR